ncbi:hypothetical protein DFJ58DRAFT_915119 [Suillus subalutaceus]|uniref:uncharacterized protein n=1 Tax=Suillus subalutaceus TaxID=48586 RepID=UPI001B86657E|nr:uncharacterized protein DFJ58DRAFT_915119 [Suillus subalutaceus]KAG1847840.1 hypothetical protein DFJ58DRAFT_915119 [Suillus subalutaceus]
MSDPISVIAGGVAVLQLIQTVAQASALLYRYVASVRNADSSCQSLLNELSAVGGVLTTVTAIKKDDTLLPDLNHALSKLMTTDGPVAKLLVELKSILPNEQAQENGKMKTIPKLMWPFKEKEAGAIIDKLKKYCGEITNILAIDSWNTLKEVKLELQEVTQGVKELKNDSAAQKVREKDGERRKFLEWMNPVFCDDKHATCCGQRNPGTGRWIFHADEYKIWNTSDHAFLWLNGHPGHGKTILAVAVEAELQTLAFFYCNFRDDRTTNAAAVLRSLIVQLLQQSQDDWITKIGEKQESNTKEDLDSLRNLWQQQRDAKPHPTDLGFLRKLLVEASTLVRRPVLVIDALDECKDYTDLVGYLVNLAEDGRLRLFVTGRGEPDIQDAFHDLPTIKLSRLSDALKKTILEKLLEKAEGMFRWVQCQLDEIVACKRRVDIEAALNNLPAGLYETYDRIIQAIKQRGPSDHQIARSCLLWLSGTFTPLTLNQLNEAMMIEVGQSNLNPDLGVMDPMDIVTACGSLVIYNEKTGIVALSHYSVKEYLTNRPNNIFKSISDMHARICKLLITYVLCDFVDEISTKLELKATQGGYRARRADVADVSKDNPLLSYAIQGCKHLGHVSEEDPCVMDALSRLSSEFLRNAKKHPVLTRGKYAYEPGWLPAGVTLPSLLFIPLQHGKPWMVESLVKQDPHLLDVDIATGWGSPLIFAMAKNPDCLSILLKPGVDFNKLSSFKPSLYSQYIVRGHSYAPISWAAVTGSKVAVDFLLSRTEVDIPNDILHIAVMANKPSPECIRKFRQRGADVNFTVNGLNPIHFVLFAQGYDVYDESPLLPVVKALVEPSCNLSLQDQAARTMLHIALDERLEDIVAYLLEKKRRATCGAGLQTRPGFPIFKQRLLLLINRAPELRGRLLMIQRDRNSSSFQLQSLQTAITPIRFALSLFQRYSMASCQSLQKDIQDSRQDDSPRLGHYFRWSPGQRVSSHLFDYHQGDKVTRMLQQLNEDEDSTGTSLFLKMTKNARNAKVFELGVECILDIYRGPLP